MTIYIQLTNINVKLSIVFCLQILSIIQNHQECWCFHCYLSTQSLGSLESSQQSWCVSFNGSKEQNTLESQDLTGKLQLSPVQMLVLARWQPWILQEEGQKSYLHAEIRKCSGTEGVSFIDNKKTWNVVTWWHALFLKLIFYFPLGQYSNQVDISKELN